MVVLKSPTSKIDFLDFLQIEAIFRKTNYITFSYLLIATSGQSVSTKKIFDRGREISILLGIYGHLLLKVKQDLIKILILIRILQDSCKTLQDLNKISTWEVKTSDVV